MAKRIKRLDKSNSKNRKYVKKEIESNQLKYIIHFAFGLLFFFLALIEGESIWRFAHNLIFGLFGFLTFFIGAIIK